MELIGRSGTSDDEIGEFLSSEGGCSLFQTLEFLRVLERTKGYEGHWIGVRDSGELIGSAIFFDITDKTPIPGLSITRRIMMGAPLIRTIDGKSRAAALKRILEGIVKTGRKPIYFEIRNLSDTKEEQKIFESCGFKFEPHLNFLIDLRKGEESLLSQMSSSGRRMVKKSLKEGLSASFPKDVSDIDVFYQILSENYTKKGLPIADVSLFRACYEILGEKYCRFILAKDKDGKIVAGRLELLYGGTMYDWYAAANPDAHSKRPNELLVWSAFREGMRLGMPTFDFGGAGRPDEEYGVREFKEKFGGKKVNFGRYILIVKKGTMILATKGYKVWNKVRTRS
jgi:hypothetical protein